MNNPERCPTCNSASKQILGSVCRELPHPNQWHHVPWHDSQPVAARPVTYSEREAESTVRLDSGDCGTRPTVADQVCLQCGEVADICERCGMCVDGHCICLLPELFRRAEK